MRGVPCFIQKNHYGYWVISDFDNQDQLVTRRYLYWNKKAAIKLFKKELQAINTQAMGATK